MGAFTGFFIGLGYDLQQNYLILILLLIIISGWVLSSQLFLKRHTFREVYSGFFIGLCGLILLFLLLSK
jgi:membrane-associated phospholipid phosphatase